MVQIMIVDDDKNSLKALQRVLSSRDRQIDTFMSAEEAIGWAGAGEVSYDLIISDYRMPELDGISFLKRIKRVQPFAAKIVLTGYANMTSLNCAINEVQVNRFIEKPYNADILQHVVAEVLTEREQYASAENKALLSIIREQEVIINDQNKLIDELMANRI